MKFTDFEKRNIENLCQPLIEELKSVYVQKNPNKDFRYLVDVYVKWHGDFLYFCEKNKKENSNSAVDEFEEKFVRLKIKGKNKFDISYMRHTGKWCLIAPDLTLKDCLDMISGIPTLHPKG